MIKTIKERPVLFSGEMVRAILDGRKVQTRRVIKKLLHDGAVFSVREFVEEPGKWLYNGQEFKCPFGKAGSRLWVRESFGIVPCPGLHDRSRLRIGPNGKGITWKADWQGNPSGFKWKPSIHMPRWASRITLEITDVRVERLNDISEDDAREEGWHPACGIGPIYWYEELWEDINGSDSWNANPWVWVVEFKRVEA